MKRVIKSNSVRVFFLVLVASYLGITTLASDANEVLNSNQNPPVISHRAVKLALQGEKINIVAGIGHRTGIKDVALTINYGKNKIIVGSLVPVQGLGPVPVSVSALKNVPVLKDVGLNQKIAGIFKNGEQAKVTLVRGEYLRILTSDGLEGYVEKRQTATLLTGEMFGASIPESMTMDNLSYKISVVSNSGDIAQTDEIHVKFLDENEIAYIKSELNNANNNELNPTLNMALLTK